MAKLTRKQLLKTGAIGAAAMVATLATQTQVMANDDKLDRDAEVGATDISAQVRRFNRVNDILQRAIARYDQIIADIGSPSSDPTVQAALQAIVLSGGGTQGGTNPVDGIITRVLIQPGPVQDPAVGNTLGLIASVGVRLANEASARLGVAPPCAT